MAFESLSDKLTEAFKRLRGKGRLTEADVKEAMREVKLALLEADVNFKVVKDFVRKVTERATGADVLESLSPAQMVIKIVNEELTALMGSENQKLNISSQSPSVVMLVGLQGAGKTTNGAKLAGLMRKQGKRPLLVACDVYRPAAIQQLETVGRQLDIPVFQMGQGDPVEIAKAGIEHAKQHGNDLVFLDTAGRLHIDEALMTELLTLIEKAEQTLDQKKAEEMAERLRQNRFTLTDYYDQLQQLKGMGSLQDIAGMIPGMDAKALSGANVDEKAMGRIEAIIQSMTPGERDNPAILNSSRKKRIAAGAGTSVVEINKLLKQFELMQQLVRQMSGNSKAMKRMKRGGRGGFGGLGNLFGGGGRPYGF